MILPHERFLADTLKLEVYRGWIVGDTAIVNSTSIATQRGDGVANVRVHPIPSVHPASFDTVTGGGRTDVSYIENQSSSHRPISSQHTSSMNGDLYLTYRDARFSGLVALHSVRTLLQVYSPPWICLAMGNQAKPGPTMSGIRMVEMRFW